MNSTLFPVLHIRRPHFGIYDWQLTQEGELLAHDDGLASIEECLTHSLHGLSDDVHALKVWYRNVGLGTYPAQALRTAPDVVAERVVELFSAVIDSRT